MVKSKGDTEKLILDFINSHPGCSSAEIHHGVKNKVAYATIKRNIQVLLLEKLIVASGKGKATRYEISRSYNLLYPIDTELYFQKEIDDRNIVVSFNFELIRETLSGTPIFTDVERSHLANLQNKFRENTSKLSDVEFSKEFERLAIDLSWKSSQIEGNTYSLLETERLLKEKETASGKTKDEAVMLLNHKAALDFILEHPDYAKKISISKIEALHSILIKDLNIDRNIRNRGVGITGTNYRPLDNKFQIRESLDEVCTLVNTVEDVFEKALLLLVLISYIQPFTDGNKRTARILSNAVLMNYHYCPISFRTVDSIDYKKAMLIFYEQNNISAFKRIFIEQFEFAVKTYF